MRTASQNVLSLPTPARVLVHGARWFDRLQPIITFGREASLNRRLVEMLGAREGDRVLDVGCATGVVTEAVAQRVGAGKAIGVDASGPMIEEARRRRGHSCWFELGLAEDLPFPDGSFDAVVSSLLFHHLPLELKRRAAREMARVLRPGGRFAAADIDRPWNLFGWLYGGAGRVLLFQPEIGENLRGVLTGIFAESGFREMTSVRAALGCVRIWTGKKELR